MCKVKDKHILKSFFDIKYLTIVIKIRLQYKEKTKKSEAKRIPKKATSRGILEKPPQKISPRILLKNSDLDIGKKLQ